MRFRSKNFLKDKRGDAMFIFIVFLFSLFGIMFIGYADITRASITRQKLYNAVQDGLTLARSQAVKIEGNKVRFDNNKAYSLIKQCLDNNRIRVKSLNTWYSGGRIYASGRTSEGTPFTYSIQVYKNFR
jgi:Flp pilus assembly protein TadG